jgi:hypothetical protein
MCNNTVSGIFGRFWQNFEKQLLASTCPLSTGALYGRSQRVTIPDAVTIQFIPPEDVHSIARNMWRNIM